MIKFGARDGTNAEAPEATDGTNAAPAGATPENRGAATRIDDFGQHIPGARKDAATWRLDAGLQADPEFGGTLAKAWPAPDWNQLAREHAAAGYRPEVLACVRAIRDELRTPDGRKLEQRVHTKTRPGTTGLRQLALAVLEGKATPGKALERLHALSQRAARDCARRIILYTEIGHRTDLARYCAYPTRNGGNDHWIVTSSARRDRGLGQGATLVDAVRELRRQLEQQTAEEKTEEKRRRTSRYSVRYVTGPGGTRIYGIWRKASGRWMCAREYGADVAAARRGLTEDIDELEQWWEQWRRVPPSRRAQNTARTPPGTGGTGDPLEFTRRFGFRGVQFGNWVEDARRRRDLADASQALADLALALGWPEAALSLGGCMALAFGARGGSGPEPARAHYEPNQRVIAISKPSGPGTLAHEWFHALDHHAALVRGVSGYATCSQTRRIDGPLDELAGALRRYGTALAHTPMQRRARRLDRRRPRSKPYWSTTIEMAARGFEAWVVHRLAEHGIRNDYLANVVDANEWQGNPELDLGYPYPYADELMAIARELDNVAEAGRKAAEDWAAETRDGANLDG